MSRIIGGVKNAYWGFVSRMRSRTLVPLLAILFPLLAVGLWFFLDWQLDTSTPQGKKDMLQLWIQTLGGTVLLVGVYLTWRRVAATERTVEVAQEGQITERFTRAIEQLGDDKLEIRLGAIYALERIARDSERDHWPIMEVLTAYVRENAPWIGESEVTTRTGAWTPLPPPRPSTDIQAILTVISRRERWYGHGEDESLDMSKADLRGANLDSAHLESANLIETRMQMALLGETHLEGAYLIEAHLGQAFLYQDHLEGAILREAHLEKTELGDAHLEGADLRDATGLTKERIESAYTDENTILPDYLKAPVEAQEEART